MISGLLSSFSIYHKLSSQTTLTFRVLTRKKHDIRAVSTITSSLPHLSILIIYPLTVPFLSLKCPLPNVSSHLCASETLSSHRPCNFISWESCELYLIIFTTAWPPSRHISFPKHAKVTRSKPLLFI